tara:strand:+ start:197 stop:544 length:348 start_codon:yes stop_codon:yes gene_type:complete
MHQLLETVRKLAEDNPTAVYEAPDEDGCYYTLGPCGNGDGCIIGQALLKDDSTLKEKLTAIDAEPLGAEHLFDEYLDMTLTKREIRWLAKVQESQDDHECWQTAVDIADEEVGGV